MDKRLRGVGGAAQIDPADLVGRSQSRFVIWMRSDRLIAGRRLRKRTRHGAMPSNPKLARRG